LLLQARLGFIHLIDHLGKKVKEVFASPEVDVAGRFAKYEQESYEKITKMIDQVDAGDAKTSFTFFSDVAFLRP
jgi:hypothetical protein